MRHKFKKTIGVILTCGMLSLAMPNLSHGQEILLPRAALTLEQEQVVAEGVRHLTYQGILADEEPIKIQVIEADLKNREVEVKPMEALEGIYGKRESVSSMGARSGAVAAINGGYYNTSPPYNPVGNVVIDGELLVEQDMYRTSLGWMEDGSIRFGYFNPKTYEEEPYWQGLKHLLTGGPLLIEEGKPVFQYTQEGFYGTLESRHPRTAVGITEEGKMLLVTVDGRQTDVSLGVTFDELIFLMLDLGAKTAMCLDGGGSTTAWVNGQVVNQFSGGSQRVVVNSIIVRSGISVFMDGKRIYYDVPPRLEKGRTLVPLRALLEGLGAQVDWEEKTQTVIAMKDGLSVRLPIGSKKALVSGDEIELDVPAIVEKGRTLVPLRFIGEIFGAQVDWDPAKIITITTGRPK